MPVYSPSLNGQVFPFHRLVLALLMLVVPMLTGCGNKWKHRLSEKELENLLIDLYTVQGLAQQDAGQLNDTLRLALHQQVYDRYGVTERELDSIIGYYGYYKPDRLAAITDRASQRLTTQIEYLKEWQADQDKIASRIESTESQNTWWLGRSLGTSIEHFMQHEAPHSIRLTSMRLPLLYCYSFTDSLTKGTAIQLTATLRAIDSVAKEAGLEMYLAISSRGQLFQNSTPIQRNGRDSVTLSLPKGIGSGELLLAIDAAIPSRVESVEISGLSLALNGKTPITDSLNTTGIQYPERLELTLRDTLPKNMAESEQNL